MKRKNILTILAVLSAIILITAFLLVSAAYYRQSQLNKYTRNILFSENYFLRNYTNNDENASEYQSHVIFTAAEVQKLMTSLIGKDYTFIQEKDEYSKFDIFSLYYEHYTEISGIVYVRELYYDHFHLTNTEVEVECEAEDGAEYYNPTPLVLKTTFTAKELEDFKTISKAIVTACKNADISVLSYEELDAALEKFISSSKIIDIDHISQLPEYPNGCEAVSAVMLLKHRGFDISKEDFIESYLECGEVRVRFGVRYGPNPEEKYAGDPASGRGGWGCFAPVIANALNAYLADTENTAVNVSGASLEMLCERFINLDIPVAVWITTDSEPVSEVYQWLSTSGNDVYLYPTNQHCAVLCGYDEENYYFCDPLSESSEYLTVPRDKAEKAYNSMGSQAVIIK